MPKAGLRLKIETVSGKSLLKAGRKLDLYEASARVITRLKSPAPAKPFLLDQKSWSYALRFATEQMRSAAVGLPWKAPALWRTGWDLEKKGQGGHQDPRA
eukprot:2532030-Amphidinium_carterae.1